jgi:nucleotide-binding universal stress UspA family protein
MNDVLANDTHSTPSGVRRPFRLKKILLAYDGSKAAERALADAATLARRFQSEITAVRVGSPEVAPLDTLAESRNQRTYAETELQEINDRLKALALNSRGIVRTGAVGDTLFNLCVEEDADLLMFGAYGLGSQDRHTLGSTAEQLLSALPCPAMVYGPSVKFPLLAEEDDRPILLPVSFPMTSAQIHKAIEIALFFSVSIEVLHVVDTINSAHLHELEDECKRIVSLLQDAGVTSTWSVLYGQPWKAIVKRSSRLASPFILLPIKYRHIMVSDHVAAHTIRESDVPVLTYSAI